MEAQFDYGESNTPKKARSRERSPRKGLNFGAVSLVVLLLSLIAGYWGYHALTGIACDSFSEIGNTVKSAVTGFYMAAFFWMISIAIAGVGLAAGRRRLLAVLALVLNFLPMLILGYVLLTGNTPDFMDIISFGGSSKC